MDIRRGDCLELIRTLGAESVDMVVCDPPYGCTKNRWDTVVDLPALFAAIERVARPDAVVIFFSQGMLTAELMTGPWRKHWRYNLVWAKNKVRGALNANRQPLRAHEDIIVFYRRPPTYHPQMNTERVMGRGGGNPRRRTSEGSNYGTVRCQTSTRHGATDRHPTSVLLFRVVNEKDCIHPTQKPVDLMEFLIRSYTDAGQTVLDPMMGSGTTGVACRNTDRAFVGFERDPQIFQTAKSRLSSSSSLEQAKPAI